MNASEDRRTGLPPGKAEPCGSSPEQQSMPDSPGAESSGMSMRSDTSLQHFTDFKRSPEQRDSPGPESSSVSMKSDASLQHFIEFKRGSGQKIIPVSPGSEHVCQRRRSKESPLEMSPEQQDTLDSPVSESISMMSKENPLAFRKSPEMRVDLESTDVLSAHVSQQDSVLKILEDNVVTFVKNELKKIPKFLSLDYPESLGREREDEVVLDMEEEKERRRIREAFLQISVHFLKKMNQTEVAETLQSRYPVPVCFQQKLKSHLKEKFQCVFQGISKAGKMTPLNQIYTELYITEGEPGEVNTEHEVTQIESMSRKPERLEKPITHEDIFVPPTGRERPIRTVMTKGVAGIGKTVLTQKFALDWAEDKSNQDIQFTFPFTFRELNLVKHKKFSLVQLIHHFFAEIKEAEICRLEHFPVVFIFDGLDECRPPLNFHRNEIPTDVTEPASVNALLTSLIRGKLLPSARLWITTRPAAADQILPEYIDMVTEVRGFTDPQKEEYFRKRFSDEDQANKIVSHIKTSRSLHIMCHIPIFCWITATVLENVLRNGEEAELPRTLTDMYIRFLIVQSEVKNARNYGGAKTDPQSKDPQNKEMIESLGKLAFEHLQIGNLIFYESDLQDSGIDVTEASVYSGLLTQIFIEERGLFQDKVFCFVHLSVQEFLAAFYVHLMFVKSGINLLSEEQKCESAKPTQIEFYQSAVDKALESTNGKFDLFLRFLLGLSMQTSQSLLRGLLKQTESSSQINEETVKYIKHKVSQNLSQEKSINLFHCLNELKDSSLVEEIQKYLRAGNLSPEKLSPAQWSALVFILLSSEKDLDVFDMKKYCDSEEALPRLLPVVRAANKAILSGCNLSERSCGTLASVLSSQSCSLRELDLSNNNLRDSGVRLLSEGLRSPHCTLKTLRLSGCLIREEGCSSLASALSSNPSHLKELDLSYNHPGESGVKLLSALQHDPGVRLSMLSVEPAGVQWLKPGLKKYSYDLTVDTNTVNTKIRLSEDNRLLSHVDEDQMYPSHEDRFDHWPQLLSRRGLTGRCYWEVEWNGRSHIAVTYRGINRRGKGYDCLFGRNDQSWSLVCSDTIGYSFWHNNKATYITVSAASSASDRVAVYLDWPAGTLSFYRVSSDIRIHLHTCNTKFSEPLYPGFRFWSDRPGSTIRLCSPEENKGV